MKVAILFENYGPYHVARLRAAGKFLSVRGIELRQASADYSWHRQGLDYGLEIVALPSGDTGRTAPKLANLLCEVQLDAVCLPGWASGFSLSGLRWCQTHNVPAILMSESQTLDAVRSLGKERIKRQLVSMYSAGLVGGTSHQGYLTRLGMPEDRIFLGYDAVDNDYFAKGAAETKAGADRARSHHGLPENYFLASARFVEKKNLRRLLQAYARYRILTLELLTQNTSGNNGASAGQRTPWDLVLLGEGPLRPSINSEISALSLHGHVHLPGFRQYPNLPAFYALANAFIHASTIEQWGLVVNEAMVSGLPVLVSNRCGCAPDLVQEGVNGFTFDPYNIEELARLMLRLSNLKSQLAIMGLESQRIIANWGPERFASGLKAAVDKALQVGPKRAKPIDRGLLWVAANLRKT